MEKSHNIEIHPFDPFLPENAKILIMGTFPPPAKRWSMNFYYPNITNDFWPMMGWIFYRNKEKFYNPATKKFNLEEIKSLLYQKGIAMNDTGYKILRHKGNASDKFLEIIEPVDLYKLLDKIPNCKTLATTGEKAANQLALLTNSNAPKMGEMIKSTQGLEIWRMPSTSRAYPLLMEKKAEFYERMFEYVGIL